MLCKFFQKQLAKENSEGVKEEWRRFNISIRDMMGKPWWNKYLRVETYSSGKKIVVGTHGNKNTERIFWRKKTQNIMWKYDYLT